MKAELKQYHPITAGSRHRVILKRTASMHPKAIKKLTKNKAYSGGRNHHGCITVHHRSRSAKHKYRMVDFKRVFSEIPARILALEYDPNRTALLALLQYANGMFAYMLAPQNVTLGDVLLNGSVTDFRIGNSLPLKKIPLGTLIYNLELKPLKGGQMIRAAGMFAQLLRKDRLGFALIRFHSGTYRLHSEHCLATLGRVSNVEHQNTILGKAGAKRWLGKSSIVRGVAKNPIDHPHGGNTSIGGHPVTPWGKPAKGQPTRNQRRLNKQIIRN